MLPGVFAAEGRPAAVANCERVARLPDSLQCERHTSCSFVRTSKSDLARLTELTIETFRPFYEDSFRPLVGETIFAIQHGNWRDDYRKQVAELHDPAQHKYVAVAEEHGVLAGYVAWSVDPARRQRQHRHPGRRGGPPPRATSAPRSVSTRSMRCEQHGAEMVEIGTGGDDFHAPARALYESLGCIKLPVAVYFREL